MNENFPEVPLWEKRPFITPNTERFVTAPAGPDQLTVTFTPLGKLQAQSKTAWTVVPVPERPAE